MRSKEPEKNREDKTVKNKSVPNLPPRNYWRAYQFATQGHSDNDMARLLGCRLYDFKAWMVRYPAFKEAVEEGRAQFSRPAGSYIYDRLSPEAQRTYDELLRVEDHPNALAKLEALFRGQGVRMRQLMFIQSLSDLSFNTSKACRRVGICLKTFKEWVSTDPDFAQLYEECMFHKANFVEEALMDLVARRNPQAVMFANRSLNRARGYGDHLQVETTTVERHEVTIDLSDLELPPDVARVVLEALERREQRIIEHGSSDQNAGSAGPQNYVHIGGTSPPALPG